MKLRMQVEMPTQVRQGSNTVMELLGAVAQGLVNAAREKVEEEGQPQSNASVREKEMAAREIRACMARIREQSSEIWREFHEARQAAKKAREEGEPHG